MCYSGATLYLHTSGLSKELLEESHCYSKLVVAVWLHRCAFIRRRWPGNKVYRCLLRQQSRRGDNVRYQITTNFGNTATSAHKIQALPPTTEALIENVKRSHLQTGTWKATLDPPALDPVENGYVRHEPFKTLLPTTVPEGVTLAPDGIMTLIKCNCEGASACRNMRCSCSRSRLPCTLISKCNAGDECLNELTKTVAIPREVTD